jgi:hypothetical protein
MSPPISQKTETGRLGVSCLINVNAVLVVEEQLHWNIYNLFFNPFYVD